MQHSITYKSAVTTLSLLSVVCCATGQELSSSLYNTGGEYFADPFAEQVAGRDGVSPGRQTDTRRLSAAVMATSFMAVPSPEPRTFAVHDLITIVIREDTQTKFKSSLETEKDSEYTGEVAEFPRLTLTDLLNAQLSPNTFPNGTLKVDVKGGSKFEGEGDYANQQTMSGRIQATVIDIKPNGNVVVEARKSVQSDDEHYTLVAPGTCRVDDIAADNTVLSSQLADLFIDKQHEGYLKRVADKGAFSKIMDFLFPW